MCNLYVLCSADVYVHDLQKLGFLDGINVDVACDVLQRVLVLGRCCGWQRQACDVLWSDLRHLPNLVTGHLVSDEIILRLATLVEVLQEVLDGGRFIRKCWQHIGPCH